MNAGALRHRITFDRPTANVTSSGQDGVTFAEAFTVSGMVEPIHGRERLTANQVNAEMDTRIRIRWSENASAVGVLWRARHGGVVYNIVSVAHVGYLRREIEIMAQSGVNDG